MSSTRAAKRQVQKKRQTAAKRVGPTAATKPKDFPPARIACFQFATGLLKTVFNLPQDMDVQGVTISEDGNTVGFFVEWPKLPEIKYGDALPALVGTLEPGKGLLEGEPVLTLEKLRWEQPGNPDAYLWIKPSAASKRHDEMGDIEPPPERAAGTVIASGGPLTEEQFPSLYAPPVSPLQPDYVPAPGEAASQQDPRDIFYTGVRFIDETPGAACETCKGAGTYREEHDYCSETLGCPDCMGTGKVPERDSVLDNGKHPGAEVRADG